MTDPSDDRHRLEASSTDRPGTVAVLDPTSGRLTVAEDTPRADGRWLSVDAATVVTLAEHR